MSKFKKLQEHILKQIMVEKCRHETSICYSGFPEVVQKFLDKCDDRMSHLDETVAIYLAKLTNSYMYAIQLNYEHAISKILTEFNELGFDITIYDAAIAEMPHTIFSGDGVTWPCETQERILMDVFSFFECPIQLPSVSDIMNSISKFGIKSGEETSYIYEEKHGFKFPVGISTSCWINTKNFDDPSYNTFGEFETALKNGLSVSEIIETKCNIDYALEYYSSILNSFARPWTVNVTTIVPFLEHEYKRISESRAPEIYAVAKRRFGDTYPDLVEQPVSKQLI